MRELLGGKGANLCEMTNLKIPVPQGFIVATTACTDYMNKKEISKEIKEEIFEGVKKLEKVTGKQFGNPQNPLLLSVRSGARVSMPGMMNTVLNLGMNDNVCQGLAQITNRRSALDSYRRFIQMFSDVVMGLDMNNFENILSQVKSKNNIEKDIDLTEEMLEEVIQLYKELYVKHFGQEFPQDINHQLLKSVEGVFQSWNTERAVAYRQLNHIPADWGTAVNVQEMVFGNLNNNSATGVAFTRNPATGENKIYGEFLVNAQGEDIVSGVRTPQPISELKKFNKELYAQFEKVCRILEHNYLDMQDMEFTIENGKLFMLQTRNGKRTAKASLKIAIDMVKEQLITQKQALLQIDAKQVTEVLHPTFTPESLKTHKHIAKGLPASPGSAVGYIVFNTEQAKKFRAENKKCVLVREETSPEDIIALTHAEGVLTARGGMTSHAAVVARGMGKCCVAGCGEIQINEHKKEIIINGKKYTSNNIISLNGDTGLVYGEELETMPNTQNKDFETIMKWAKKYKKMGVRANADTIEDAKIAKQFGAEGIGLVRTEHMFFKEERIWAMRETIVASTAEQQAKGLAKLEPMQQLDFYNILKEMGELPTIIRLLDPPLHEFLPKTEKDVKKLAKQSGKKAKDIWAEIEKLKEVNPMMGLRGCRLSVVSPEITKMQARALVKATKQLEEENIKSCPELMVPLTTTVNEFKYVKNLLTEEINKTSKQLGTKTKIKIGTMIETPRAAVISPSLAPECEFYSFGTNDLTQLTFGFSRDDSNKFLNKYTEQGIFVASPFETVDTQGVGELVKNCVKLSKAKNKKLECGVCGEHGGEADSVKFFAECGLDYVSCSAFRVPVAILSSAQAQIRQNLR